MPKASVFISIFCMDERGGWLHPSLMEFMASQQPGRNITVHLSKNYMPIDFSRNLATRAFLSSSAEWALFLDNDMAPPPDLLSMVDTAGAGMHILFPQFYRGAVMPDGTVSVQRCWQLMNPGPPKTEWNPLVCGGGGAMFIRKEVFQALGNDDWFRFTYGHGGQMTLSEDILFCRTARAAGFSLWGNMKYLVEHHKSLPISSLTRGVRVLL